MALDWLPRTPDPIRLRGRISLHPSRMAMNIDPIINPPPPTELTWHPTYPDRCWSQTSLRTSTQRASSFWLGPPLIGLAWKSTYPDRIGRLRLVAQRPTLFAPISGAILDIPKRGGWRPIYPAWIARRLPVREGVSVYRTDPTILLDGVRCIQFIDELVIASTLIEESLRTSTLVDESLLTSTLASEEFC